MEHMITTIFNPWNPFLNYKEWSQFDREMGFNTAEKLASYVLTTDDLGEKSTLADIEEGIQNILDNDVLGVYIRVTKDTEIKPISIDEYAKMVNVDI